MGPAHSVNQSAYWTDGGVAQCDDRLVFFCVCVQKRLDVHGGHPIFRLFKGGFVTVETKLLVEFGNFGLDVYRLALREIHRHHCLG